MKQRIRNLKNIFSDKILMTLLFVIIILAALLFIIGEDETEEIVEESKEEEAAEVVEQEATVEENISQETPATEAMAEEPKDEFEREQKYASFVNLKELTPENCEETQEIINSIYASYVMEKEDMEDKIKEIKEETEAFNAKAAEMNLAPSVKKEKEDYLRENLYNMEKELEETEKLIKGAGGAKDSARATCLRIS